MKSDRLLADIVPRYFHPLVAEAMHKAENKTSTKGGIYWIVSRMVEDVKKRKEINQLLLYRNSFLYSIMENIKPYERTNAVAYELALRTPEIIEVLDKNEISASDLKRKYWLDKNECMHFEETLFIMPEKNVHISRDPFVFTDRRRGTVMRLPYSYPKISIPKSHQTLMVNIDVDLTLPDDEVSSTMDALKLSLIEYKKRMDQVMPGSLEKDFLNSKEGYFKSLKNDDNATTRNLKQVKYPNAKNSSITERFFAYDMSKAGFTKQNIMESIMIYRYSTVLRHTNIELKENEENIKDAEKAMTKLTRATTNTWIEIVQDSIEKQLYRKYISPGKT